MITLETISGFHDNRTAKSIQAVIPLIGLEFKTLKSVLHTLSEHETVQSPPFGSGPGPDVCYISVYSMWY